MLSALIPLASLLALAQADWSTYPSVAKTASINGFADKIYDQLPSCAQACVKQPTSSTPCPYWDTGCLCVMSTFASSVADCIAQNCKGGEVHSAQSLATSVCSGAGVGSPYWFINSGASSSLAEAGAATATAEDSTKNTSSTPEPTTAPTTTEGEHQASLSAAVTKPPTTTTERDHQSLSAVETESPTTTSKGANTVTRSSGEGVSSSASTRIPQVSPTFNAAAGVAPAAGVGLLVGVAMLI